MPEEKVLVVIDGDNMREFFETATDSVDNIVSHYVNGRELALPPKMWLSVTSLMNFYNKWDIYPRGLEKKCQLVEVQLTLQTKRHAISEDGKIKKGYPDMVLLIHAMRHITKFNTLMVFTQDLDFHHAIAYIRNDLAKRVEVYSPMVNQGYAIQRDADSYTNIAEKFSPK